MTRKWGMVLLLGMAAVVTVAAISYERIYSVYTMTVPVDSGATQTTQSDTFYIGNTQGFKTISGMAIISGPSVLTDTAGSAGAYYGSLDSASLILKSRNEFVVYTLDSARRNAALPCTLRVAVPETQGDTLLIGELLMIAVVGDSAANRHDTLEYAIKYDLLMK